ncbi:MAG: MarR family transcriptional regulator [Clostridia bacterium]|nr:MarR family transcriptional regulator [Clostridia bacterium]
MAKTIDEELFEKMIHIPHMLRKRSMEENEMRGECPKHHGHREGPGFGPGGCHGPEHGPNHGHGPEHGLGQGHGPGRGHRPFSRERVLNLIQDSETGLRQKEVSEALRIGASATSELIDKLELDGYVRRTVDPDDKRATRLVLTEMGEARANEVRDQHQKRIGSMFANLTEGEKEELLRLLEKMMARPSEE